MNPELFPIEIYVLIDPRTSEIRYVGQSKNPKKRLRTHRYQCYSKITPWLRELEQAGIRPRLEVIANARDRVHGEQVEHHWIRYFRRRGVALFNYHPNDS